MFPQSKLAHVGLALALVLTFAAGQAQAGPLTTTVNSNTPDVLDVIFSHGPVATPFHIHLGSTAGPWNVTAFILSNDPAVGPDTLGIGALGAVSLLVQTHVTTPHPGEPASLLIAQPLFGPQTGAGPAGTVSLIDFRTATHPVTGHIDFVFSTLEFTRDGTGQITNFSLHIQAIHEPEPTSIVVFGLAGLGLAAYRRRQQRVV